MEVGEVRGEDEERERTPTQIKPPLVFSWFGEEEGETR